ncbi:MAG: hypothetical protein A2X45_23670 [Lentisphaerae bacterium GWF2_50_93]|nr:MAG: hypothetical protein A2X45_23670 [Lentisphaerae bacterium GWF2_50_93]
MTMFALADCNNFYVSCERAFNPKLEDRPVVVLSNNDGCIIARSEEAKSIGIGMGNPFFQVRDIIDRYDVQVFSSNYTLYGDMSTRVMSILSEFTPEIEVYSIDEAFMNFNHLKVPEMESTAREIRRKVKQWTGIPVSIGIAATKTLAKLANRTAKKNPASGGVFLLDSDEKIKASLARTETGDIWGIGRHLAKRLQREGVYTAQDLAKADDVEIKKILGVCGLRTAMELRGVSCIKLEDAPAPRKSVCCSRSFGRDVSTLDDLSEAISLYTADAAERLRHEKLAAGTMTVFLDTGRFRKKCPYYFNSVSKTMAVPSSNTGELAGHAIKLIQNIYREKFIYKKAGIIFTDLSATAAVQLDLFSENPANFAKSCMLSETVDSINRRFGDGSVFYANEGVGKSWAMLRGRCSPHYTTKWDEIPEAG